VSDAIIDALLSENQGSELERAREVWKKKFDSPPADAAEQARQIRYLQSRGFMPAAIRLVVSNKNNKK
jgi:regulatory protein